MPINKLAHLFLASASIYSLSLVFDIQAATFPTVNATNFPAGTYSDSNPTDLKYRYFVPSGYNHSDTTTKYPLVLFLHGAGEKGTDNSKQLNNNANGAMIFISSANPDNQSDHPCFWVAPQCPLADWATDYLPNQIQGMLDHFLATYQIDPDRVYLTGLSMGGGGTTDQLNRFPNRYAAANANAGWVPSGSAENYAHIPMWAFHCANDGIVSVNGSDQIVQQMRNAGGKPIYTRYDTGGHGGSWNRAYNSATPLVPWMMSQRRGQQLATSSGPNIRIISPTTSGAFSTSNASVELSGEADADTTIIRYRNNQFFNNPQPTVQGTSQWNVTASPLRQGVENIISLEGETKAFAAEGNGKTLTYDFIVIDRTTPNQAPTVDAGPDLVSTIESGNASFSLQGTVSDDGLPQGAILSTLWTKVSGPGNVTFTNASNTTTTANVSEAGNYILRLTANDSSFERFDELQVTVRPEGSPEAILFDFGSSSQTTSGNWNNVTATSTGIQIVNAVDVAGGATGISLSINRHFAGINSSGITSNVIYPENAVSDSFYVGGSATSEIVLSGLNTNQEYQLRLFASRAGAGDRITVYSIGPESKQFDAVDNTTTVVPFDSLSTETGSLSIEIKTDDGAGFAYLGVMELLPIARSPYETWITEVGLTTENGKLDDPDKDSLVNFLEYALGMNPNVPNLQTVVIENGMVTQTGLPIINIESDNSISYYFTRRKDYLQSELTYTVQYSSNLSQWNNSSIAPNVIFSNEILEVVHVSDPLFTPSNDGQRYLRLKVQ